MKIATLVFTLIFLICSFAPLFGQTIDTIYYQNTTKGIKAIEHKKEDVYHGTYKMWYSNGQLKMSGNITNGRWTGDWVYFNPDGGLHKKGKYVNSLNHGVWSMYDLRGELMAEKTYENGSLKKMKFTNQKNRVYYEYNYETPDLEIIPLKVKFDVIAEEEYILFEPIMLSNIQFLEDNPNGDEFGVLSHFVTIWTSNCPYLGGQLDIEISNYYADWISIENTYAYSSTMTVCFLLGKCAYLIENQGMDYDQASSDVRGTESMIRAYRKLLEQNEAAGHVKIDQLVKKYDEGQLEAFIRTYDKE